MSKDILKNFNFKQGLELSFMSFNEQNGPQTGNVS